MYNGCSYAVTNSSNATITVATKPGMVYGAMVNNGSGALSIYDGTALVMVVSTTNRPVMFQPGVRFRTSILATMSGTGVATVFYG